jgi:ABC-type tungstate transport system permease subunit
LRLATTHTLNDSGLLDALLAAFQRETGVRVKPIVAGTGQALRLAERGDAISSVLGFNSEGGIGHEPSHRSLLAADPR